MFTKTMLCTAAAIAALSLTGCTDSEDETEGSSGSSSTLSASELTSSTDILYAKNASDSLDQALEMFQEIDADNTAPDATAADILNSATDPVAINYSEDLNGDMTDDVTFSGSYEDMSADGIISRTVSITGDVTSDVVFAGTEATATLLDTSSSSYTANWSKTIVTGDIEGSATLVLDLDSTVTIDSATANIESNGSVAFNNAAGTAGNLSGDVTIDVVNNVSISILSRTVRWELQGDYNTNTGTLSNISYYVTINNQRYGPISTSDFNTRFAAD